MNAIAAPERLAGGSIVVLLADGPCAGRHETVAAWGAECWARIGKPGGFGVESQMWSRYDHDPFSHGEYRYSGITVTTSELEAGVHAMQAAGHTFGESRGA